MEGTSVWLQLIIALIGAGITLVCALGLAMGGNLPAIRFPQRLKPTLKFLYVIGLIIGLTLLLDYGRSDLLNLVLRELGVV